MMKQGLLTLLIAFFCLGEAMAQRTCGAMDHLQMMEQADPKVVYRRAQIEAQMQEIIQQQEVARSQVVYNIPVVFHVVYNGAGENVPDNRLMEQLAVLNNDFRKVNADTGSVPTVWKPLAADCEINFCLATIDPSGNPTTGITRTSTSASSFGQNDAVKYTANGGRDAWPRDQYLNIWVCDLSGGLLGYAQFPGGAAATDGVVIDYQYTGITGASAPFNRGRTATHEVGHWFNLFHIWGDDNGACNGSDQVNDTPNQANATGGCFTAGTVRTDACATTAPGYMWMNYMDYTDDACMYMFTAGQRARVQACMAGPRAALALSNRCGAGILANFSASVTQGCAPLAVSFTNQTIGNATSYLWNFGNGATSTQANPTYTYTTPGTYTVTLIAYGGGGSDTLVQTNYITVTGAVTGVALPFTETFESNSFATNNWTLVNPDAAQTWEIVTTGGTTPGTRSARVDFYNYNAPGSRDGMVTRALNFNGLTSATLTFDHAFKRYYTTNRSDSLIIYVSTNSCGNNWTRVFAIGENGSQNFATTTGTGGNVFVPSAANQWCAAAGNAPCYTINLNAFVGNPDVRVKFEAYNDYGNNLYIDNINITGVQGQAAPVANFNANATTICAGQSVSFTDASTNSPTSWSWNFGDGNTSTSQNPSHTYNTAGTYTVTLTATNSGGSDQEVRTNYIVVRPRPTVTANPTATTCAQNNGGVTLSVSGGTPNYSYLWSNGATTQNLTNVATGTYTVTVTDANTCSRTASGTVTAVAAPTVNTGNIIHTTCGQNNGSASVAASGGTPGYTYLWSNGATTTTVNGLAPGTYTVSVTDASGCVRTGTATINASNGPSATISNTVSASCGQSNGSATVTASGGAGGYTYLWSNGATSATASGLGAGSYTVTVTSAGCTTTTTATVSNTGAPTANIFNFTNTSCGQNNGVASVVATGGAGGYTYLWSNGTTNSVANNLAGGTYTVTVTDQSNCSAVTSVTIAGSSVPTANTTVQSASCGQNNGSATASATGGAGSYTYLWSNGATSATASGLGAGTYTVTVTDQAGCTGTASATISQSGSPAVSISGTQNASCGQANGSATVTASGGAGGYTYLWSNGQSSSTASNLAAGSYTVTVTDGAGCSSTATAVVQSSGTTTVTLLQQQNVLCAGGNNGAASSSASGGTAPYTYLWSNGATTAAASGLSAGTYTVTATDATGCSAVTTVTITEPSALNVVGSFTPDNGGAGDGTATATVSGGSTPYTYLWSNGGTTATITNLSAGLYTVTVTDAHGCTEVVGVDVLGTTAVGAASLIELEVFPNPNQGAFSVQFSLPEMETVRMQVFNSLGQSVWAYQTLTLLEGKVDVQLPQVANGIYYLELQAGEHRVTKKLVVRD